MVCCGINSICPIHAFLLSRSVQATGKGSCWAALPGLISKGYKLQYPAQSELGTAFSIHSSTFFLSPLVLFSRHCFLWWPPIFPSIFHRSLHFPVSLWLMEVVHRALSISFHRNTSQGKQSHTACERTGIPTHTNTNKRLVPGRSNRGCCTGLMGKQATVYGLDSINLSLKPGLCLWLFSTPETEAFREPPLTICYCAKVE